MEAEQIIEEIIAQQEQRLLRCAHQIVPNLTLDDLLQPNDFPDLEDHPIFRYEEGVIEGLRTALMAIRSRKKLEI